MRNFFRLAAIIGSLPNTIANGQTADATPLMADLNFIVTQVNANAAPLTNTALLNATNSFTQPQAGVSAQAVSQFPIVGDIITGGYQTLTSTLGTNALTARSTQIIPSSAQAGQRVFLTPSQTNTGPVSLNRDSLGSFAVLSMGSGLRSGDLRSGLQYMLFLDGSNYNILAPYTRNLLTPSGVQLELVDGVGPGHLQVTSGANATISASAGVIAFGVALNLGGTGQITFPATQNPSADPNTLDDYEEGTWVPSVGGTATYSTQAGTYTKIGNRVFFEGTIAVTLIGTGNTTTISGLPFTAAQNAAVALNQGLGSNIATSIVSMLGVIASGTTSIVIRSRTAASVTDAANAIFGNTTLIVVSGHYPV